MEDDLQEWRIRYSKDRTIVQYTFDCHAEGSDAASEWHFCDDCEAHPSAPPEDAEKHGRCDTEELRLGEQGLDSAKAAAPTRSADDRRAAVVDSGVGVVGADALPPASDAFAVVWHANESARGQLFPDHPLAMERYLELVRDEWAARLYDPTGTILRQNGSMSQADWEQLSIWQTRNRSGAIDTSQRMELPIAPTTGTTSVVDHDVIVITDSDSDDSD